MSGDHNMNLYGDGTVFRGERSADSEEPTIDWQSSCEMWKAAHDRVRDERDAIAKDSDTAYMLLRWVETEMRYAGWGDRANDNNGRTDVYEAVVEFLK